MSTALLDVNVLIALFDPEHIHHKVAHEWFRSKVGRWSTCPLTTNGCIRIFGQPRFANARTPMAAAEMLRILCADSEHEFWPDSISILDEHLFALDQLQSSRHVTDIYLLGLAVRRGGHLVTFDGGIPLKAVLGAKPAHLKVLRA